MTATQVELQESTVNFIKELVEDSYAQDDIYDFIAEYGESTFVQHYVTYVELGESYSYDAVDCFIEEFGVNDLDSFQDSYRGGWSSAADYAANYVTDCYSVDIPYFVEIDWTETFNNLGCVYVNGFVFDSQY